MQGWIDSKMAMRPSMKTVTLLLAALSAADLALAADFHEGLAAYTRGDYATALSEWQPLARAGDAEAQYRIARLYSRGEGVPERDDATALKWYRAAAEQGHLRAENDLGVVLELGRGLEPDLPGAAAWYRRAAEQGLATAQGNLARLYLAGTGVERDPAAAARWYREAAEQDDALAQYGLAGLYEHGSGVPQDIERAARWYTLAAKNGHGPAQAALGAMYAEGRGVKRDAKQATKWLTRAATQGAAPAPPTSSAAPIEADTPAPPTPTAKAQAEEPAPARPPVEAPPSAAAAPEPERVFDAEESGGRSASVVPEPVAPIASAPPAEPEAGEPAPPAAPTPLEPGELAELRRAAEGGEGEAQFRLATRLGTGAGAAPDLSEAARWYHAAAAQGHALAAYKLGFLYLRGVGVPRKDYVQAFRFFQAAAEGGVGDAAAWRDKIRAKMTERELAELESKGSKP